LNVARCLHASIGSENGEGIYVFGGFNENPLDSVEYMSVKNNMWEFRASMGEPLCMHEVLKIGFK